MDKGEWTYINNSNFSATTYSDKHKVNLLTNIFDGSKKVRVTNQNRDMPASIYWYRQWLGPIDHFDRLLHLYLWSHRNIKWTQALLSGVLKIAVNNTNIIAQQLNLTSNLRETELALIDHLAGDYSVRNTSSQVPFMVKKTGWGHFPERAFASSRCVYCKSQGKESKPAKKSSKSKA